MSIGRLIGISLVLGALVAACDKGADLNQIRADGFQCLMKGGGVGGAPKDKQHCFVCTDQDSMLKCGKNPLTSGCKEVPHAECKP
jgi:hypothetical protein